MKKLLILIAMLSLAAAPLQAQGFLGKLKEKTQNLGGKLGESLKGVLPEEARQAVSTTSDESDPGNVTAVTGEQALPPKRASSFGWDGVVTPSTSKFPIPLMNELPPVPDPAELANPTEEKQIAYYQAIKAVTLRAEELNEDTTCEDQETLLWREKSNKMLSDLFGLTEAEIKMLQDENLPQAEKDRLQERMTKTLLGDFNMDDIEKTAKQYEGKSEAELTDMMGQRATSALDVVYDRNNVDIRKYMGVSPADLKAASRAQMKARNQDRGCPEMAALNSRVKAYQKEQAAKDPSFKKEADAFEKRMRQETMEASMSAGSISSMGGSMGSLMKARDKAKPIMEMEQKLARYFSDTQKLMDVETEDVKAGFSNADRKKLLALKEQIYATDDPAVYNPLFQQAEEFIRTYRVRAAKVWAADVQKRFDKMKENMSSLIKINRQAVADEIIPECALWRAPLNLVISAGDILAEAYNEFPCDYPPMYNEEVVRELQLSKVPGDDASAWFPEFSVFGAAHFDEIAAGKYVFASSSEGVFQFNGGVWTKLSDERLKDLNEMKRGAAAEGNSWTSSDGKRTVTFNGEGGYIALPEGDEIFQPHAWKAFPDKIQWIYATSTEDGKYQLILCTYKL